MADFSPVTSDGGSAFDVPNDRCDTACGVATARDTAGGGARRDIPVGYTCWKFCESLSLSLCIIKYLYIYKYIYIYMYRIYVYMYMYIECTLVVKRYLNGAVWHFSVFQGCFSQMTMNICEASYVDGCDEKHILWISMEGSTKALTTSTF